MAALGLLSAGIGLLLLVASCRTATLSQVLPASSPSLFLAYSEMGEGSSTLWATSPGNLKERRKLGAFPHQSGFPLKGAISPDGRAMALVQLPGGASRFSGANLIIINSDGSGERLLEGGIDYDIVPQWSPDSRELAFVKRTEPPPPGGPDGPTPIEIYAIGKGGQDRRLLLRDSEALDLYLVGWQPDGSQLLYHRMVAGGDELWAWDLKEGGARLLSPLAQGPAYGVHLSPDGSRIVASIRQGQGYSVVSLSLDTKERRVVSEGNKRPSNPIFTPDGRRMAYDTEPQAQRATLQIMEASSSNISLLSSAEGGKEVPLLFSPDDKWLVVRQSLEKKAPVYLLRLENGVKEHLDSAGWVEPLGWVKG